MKEVSLQSGDAGRSLRAHDKAGAPVEVSQPFPDYHLQKYRDKPSHADFRLRSLTPRPSG